MAYSRAGSTDFILFLCYFIFFVVGCMTSQLHTLDLFLFPFKVFMKN